MCSSDLNSTLPHINDTVKTIDGYEGIVHSISVLKQKAKILVTKDNEKELREYHASELTFERRNNNPDADNIVIPLPDEELDEDALKELEEMEQNDLEELTQQEEEQHRHNEKLVHQQKKYPKKHKPDHPGSTSHKKNYNINKPVNKKSSRYNNGKNYNNRPYNGQN